MTAGVGGSSIVEVDLVVLRPDPLELYGDLGEDHLIIDGPRNQLY